MRTEKFVVKGGEIDNALDFARLLLNFIHRASAVKAIVYAREPEMPSLLCAEGFDLAFGKTDRGIAVKAAGDEAALERLWHSLELAQVANLCEIFREEA